ncbi:hypothetical protein JVT61DRAFT_6906 [Boletus reticuloceps]|uniref:HNH nuclease domain-containing protein n=1 Tax=Boletus reticuloceps TaxID=495285 RepID=A0A8I2YJ63_9AGAM|nr:hypothetical protein JVT61DRAFT_6906 [Boletus reticuloceps]
MTSVDIYLSIQVDTTSWFHALSIPRRDIERLAKRPLKWLRFATFTVCGAKGHLSTLKVARRSTMRMSRSKTLLTDITIAPTITSTIWLTTRHLMINARQLQPLHDLITSVNEFAHAMTNALSRGLIVITAMQRILYPRAKATILYEQLPASLEEEVNINCIENGILLRADLHARFGKANIVFLKASKPRIGYTQHLPPVCRFQTPNFAMKPEDVPRVEQDSMPDDRTTLQYIVEPPSTDRAPVLQWDVQADWRDEDTPRPDPA